MATGDTNNFNLKEKNKEIDINDAEANHNLQDSNDSVENNELVANPFFIPTTFGYVSSRGSIFLKGDKVTNSDSSEHCTTDFRASDNAPRSSSPDNTNTDSESRTSCLDNKGLESEFIKNQTHEAHKLKNSESETNANRNRNVFEKEDQFVPNLKPQNIKENTSPGSMITSQGNQESEVSCKPKSKTKKHIPIYKEKKERLKHLDERLKKLDKDLKEETENQDHEEFLRKYLREVFQKFRMDRKGNQEPEESLPTVKEAASRIKDIGNQVREAWSNIPEDDPREEAMGNLLTILTLMGKENQDPEEFLRKLMEAYPNSNAITREVFEKFGMDRKGNQEPEESLPTFKEAASRIKDIGKAHIAMGERGNQVREAWSNISEDDPMEEAMGNLLTILTLMEKVPVKKDIIILHAHSDRGRADLLRTRIKGLWRMEAQRNDITIDLEIEAAIGFTEMTFDKILFDLYRIILVYVTKSFDDDIHRRFRMESILKEGLKRDGNRSRRVIPVWIDVVQGHSQHMQLNILWGLADGSDAEIKDLFRLPAFNSQ